MNDLATLEDVKNALRIDDDDHDPSLQLYITTASKRVRRHIAPAALEPFLDEDDEIDTFEMPEEWRTATVMLVGYWLRNPDADPDKDFADGRLPGPIQALLSTFHDPALA